EQQDTRTAHAFQLPREALEGPEQAHGVLAWFDAPDVQHDERVAQVQRGAGGVTLAGAGRVKALEIDAVVDDLARDAELGLQPALPVATDDDPLIGTIDRIVL